MRTDDDGLARLQVRQRRIECHPMAVRRQSNDDRVDIGDRLAAIASYRNRAGKLDGARRGQRLSLGQFTRANTRWRPKDRVMTRFREESRHAKGDRPGAENTNTHRCRSSFRPSGQNAGASNHIFFNAYH
ncbi:hypothetical protein EMEDMD4_490148 [Sinorhizobium medicae]|uniref:Uncharacterized protein n=1 Tax=Sinorhizobium medicae TaxID=110321 RepID=A0A508X2S5_9HYPH|nr:hypothetical protein EMEDMD4_490148 [Sinorhizobium medicae]